MKLPLQITFRHMEPSAALEARIRKLAGQLERFSSHITRCHVIVEPPSHHQHQGALFDFTVDVTLSGEEIAIRAHPADRSHEDPYVALRDVFAAARRKVQDYARKRRRDVKTHATPAHGRISELDTARGFGRIETEEGRIVYFHHNSLVGARFKDLATGVQVRFCEEPGDLGPQATSVHVIS
ncbi:MAG TPA: HPF/RaiA family ribosome-associated protein [Steroidobacteraceae bacterium]|nr:HPF/RaiA family ribosome-associated protein [Steroidobacteraceae bacterium]